MVLYRSQILFFGDSVTALWTHVIDRLKIMFFRATPRSSLGKGNKLPFGAGGCRIRWNYGGALECFLRSFLVTQSRRYIGRHRSDVKPDARPVAWEVYDIPSIRVFLSSIENHLRKCHFDAIDNGPTRPDILEGYRGRSNFSAGSRRITGRFPRKLLFQGKRHSELWKKLRRNTSGDQFPRRSETRFVLRMHVCHAKNKIVTLFAYIPFFYINENLIIINYVYTIRPTRFYENI